MPSIVFRIIYGLYKTHRKASHKDFKKAETGKSDVTSYHTCDDQAYRANGNEYVQEKWRMKKMCFMDRLSRIKMMLLEPRSDQVLLQFYQLAALLLDLQIFLLLPPWLALLRHYKLA
jgi:esterase/lipase superfamily enzyme